MNRKKFKKIGIISAVVALCVCLAYYFLGESSGNPLRIRFNLTLHKTEYYKATNDFLTQDIIQNIALHDGWEIINGCSNHPDNGGEWRCFEGGQYLYPNQKKISFKDFDAVLVYLNVPKDKYLYYADFLLHYKLDGIGKDTGKRYVELSDKGYGLRYYEQENSTDFIVDQGFLDVKKIDGHWFFYHRDWN